MKCIVLSLAMLSIILKTITFATPLRGFGRKRASTHTNSKIRFTYDNDTPLFDATNDAAICSKGSTFCEQVINYPTAELNAILREGNKYAELFGNDTINQISIGNRFGDVEDEEPLCASSARLVFPQIGITRDNSWRYILNKSNYTQGVRVEECIEKGPCKMTQNFPLGYITQCKQKYVYRQLLAVSGKGTIIKDSFKIPSCCQCNLSTSFQQRKKT